jgi:hypothetical protein
LCQYNRIKLKSLIHFSYMLSILLGVNQGHILTICQE